MPKDVLQFDGINKFRQFVEPSERLEEAVFDRVCSRGPSLSENLQATAVLDDLEDWILLHCGYKSPRVFRGNYAMTQHGLVRAVLQSCYDWDRMQDIVHDGYVTDRTPLPDGDDFEDTGHWDLVTRLRMERRLVAWSLGEQLPREKPKRPTDTAQLQQLWKTGKLDLSDVGAQTNVAKQLGCDPSLVSKFVNSKLREQDRVVNWNVNSQS